jgi:hypothetical protein
MTNSPYAMTITVASATANVAPTMRQSRCRCVACTFER